MYGCVPAGKRSIGFFTLLGNSLLGVACSQPIINRVKNTFMKLCIFSAVSKLTNLISDSDEVKVHGKTLIKKPFGFDVH